LHVPGRLIKGDLLTSLAELEGFAVLLEDRARLNALVTFSMA